MQARLGVWHAVCDYFEKLLDIILTAHDIVSLGLYALFYVVMCSHVNKDTIQIFKSVIILKTY